MAINLRNSAPSKRLIKVLLFADLPAPYFTNFPLPLTLAGYTFQEGDRLLYDGSTPGGYPAGASGCYIFHDNGNSTGTLTRADDWALGTVIEKGTIINVQHSDDPHIRSSGAWLEIPVDVIVGSGDILPNGYNYVPARDVLSSSVIIKKTLQLVLTSNQALTGIAPATVIDSWAINDGDRVFLTNQTTPAENGIYEYVAASQSFSRTVDCPVGLVLEAGWLVACRHGTSLAAGKMISPDGEWTVGAATGQINFIAL